MSDFKDQLIDFDLGDRSASRFQTLGRCELGELTCSSGDTAGIGLEVMLDMCAQTGFTRAHNGVPGTNVTAEHMRGAAS
ncbi:hypothetical protein ASD8599_01039 [Ascidiaceihabitans donghaensis]|uniref:Uncharacterized protein n=1 Tax=Ascidiaceihabitans donghaensis TaxID=1510460 RepID=A0A2R8BB74_9RHOB|nr:hypothetical protein [Ascidiaceihabitans donghaensis]SPH20304.1 hypothetical protein ASD8599_01039 [Ascidiaceihabitans donghaensis]